MRIGLLEDDTDLVDIMSLWVEMGGDDISAYTTGKSFREGVPSEKFDVMVLDWNLPDTNGLDELDWLRGDLGSNTPVIFITGRDDEKSIVEALEHGADDYMVKPVYKEVAMARIKALHLRNKRRATESGETSKADEAHLEPQVTEEYSPYMIDHSRRKISVNGVGKTLDDKEFEVAAYLFLNESRMVSHDDLYKDIWGKRPGFNASSVDTYISSIKEKLSIDESNGWKLNSIYQCGYRLFRVRK